MIQNVPIAVKEVCDVVATVSCITAWLPGIESFLAILASIATLIWFGLRFWDHYKSKK